MASPGVGVEALIRPHRPDDDAPLIDLLRRAYPLFPHSSVEESRQSVRSWDKHGRVYRRWVADLDGTLVGRALVIELKANEPDIFYTEVTVAPDHRHRGIGRRLLETVLDEGHRLEYRRLLTEVLDDDTHSKRFAGKAGFVPDGRGEQLSRLEVARANLSGFDDAEARLGNQGLRVEKLSELPIDSEHFMMQLHRLDQETHRDIPTTIEWADSPFDEWMDVIVFGPGRSAEWAWVALDGETPVGMARLRLYDRDAASNAYTGVSKPYRGRGIARALKYRTVQWCRDQGIPFIYTGNDVENHRMLSINVALGYKPLPKAIEMVKEMA